MWQRVVGKYPFCSLFYLLSDLRSVVTKHIHTASIVNTVYEV